MPAGSADRRTCKRRLMPLRAADEIDRAVAAAPELAHQLVHAADVVLELGGADADQADQVRVAAAEGAVAVLAISACTRSFSPLRLPPLSASTATTPSSGGLVS